MKQYRRIEVSFIDFTDFSHCIIVCMMSDFTNYFSGKNVNIYDEKGVMKFCKKDLCDCMDDECPGCHFPCPKCRSNKCGHECRQNRKWMFDCVELDGIPGTLKENPYSKEYQKILQDQKKQ